MNINIYRYNPQYVGSYVYTDIHTINGVKVTRLKKPANAIKSIFFTHAKTHGNKYILQKFPKNLVKLYSASPKKQCIRIAKMQGIESNSRTIGTKFFTI